MKRSLVISILLLYYQFSTAQDSTLKHYSAGVTISLPWANSFRYYDHELQRSAGKSGFFGLGLAFFYKTEKNKFSLNTGITGDLEAPIGPLDYAHTGTFSNIGTIYAELLYHHRLIKRLNILGGINYAGYRFSFTDYENVDGSYTKFDHTAGITAGAEFLIRKNAAIALLYRPALFSSGTKQYRHLLSLDFRFDINLIRK